MNVARAGALIVIVGILGACSGEDDATPSTTAAAVPTTVPTTTPATTVPTTTVAPTTAAMTAPTSPPTTPATTTPPATAPADVEQVKQDVMAAANASFEAYFDAARNPTDQAKIARLTEVMAGAKLELAAELIAGVVASGRISVENPDVPAAITAFYEDTFVYDPAAGSASIEFCRIGSDLGVIPGGNPDGTDQIVVNEVNAYRERSDFQYIDGRWFDSNGATLQKFEGAATCA